MWNKKTPLVGVSSLVCVVAAMSLATSGSAEPTAIAVQIAAADGPANSDGIIEVPDGGSSGPSERQGSPSEPSEDGTDESPGDANPDMSHPDMANPGEPPGCPFTNQPLELLI